MAKLLDKLESYIGGGANSGPGGGANPGPGGGRRIKAFRWLVLLGLIGAALLLAASLMNVKPVDPRQNPDLTPPSDQDVPPEKQTFLGGNDKSDPFSDIEVQLESRLKELLEAVVGVGTTDVMVTVDSTEETVVQENEQRTQENTTESDKNGTSRHITRVTQNGQVQLYEISGGQSPIVVKKLKPRVRGVIIVAKGAENATVHRLIQEAVSRGLDVPMHRISVVPRKS